MKSKFLIFSLIFLISLFSLYHGVVVYVVKNLISPEGSHGLLILAVSLYLLWFHREELRNAEIRPALLPGGVLLAGGCFMLLAGTFGFSLMVQFLSVIPVLLGAVLLLGGYSLFKILLLPVGYLLFFTGFMEKLLGSMSMDLQLMTARIATQFYRLTGIPVVLENSLIHLPHISLNVAPACSGVNHIVALVALAVPLAHLTQSAWIKKITLVLSAFVIGILVNGLRVALIGVYTFYFEGVDIHGPRETLYVSFIFFFGLVVLVFFSKMLNWNDSRRVNSADIIKAKPQAIDFPPSEIRDVPSGSVSFIVAALIVAVTLSYTHLYELKPAELSKPLSILPAKIAGFTSQELTTVPDLFRPYPADQELMRLYIDALGNQVEIYIGYFSRQNNDRRVIDYRRKLLHAAFSQVPVKVDSDIYRINKTDRSYGQRWSDIYFWYQMGPDIVRDEFAARLTTVRNTFMHRSNSGAVVVIQTRGREDDIKPFLEKAVPLIHSHLSEERYFKRVGI